jgi:hypothetical protein
MNLFARSLPATKALRRVDFVRRSYPRSYVCAVRLQFSERHDETDFVIGGMNNALAILPNVYVGFFRHLEV